MGDVSVYKETGDQFLPDKAFCHSFAVIKIEVDCNGSKTELFVEETPNSVRTNRPLLEAIADENNHPSSCVCLIPIEEERSFLKGKVLKVQVGEGEWRSHKINFFNSMIDEKLDRAEGGLAGSGSRFICTLCKATKDSAKSELGSFCVCRTYEENAEIAEYIPTNPDNLTKERLYVIAQGVKSAPLLKSDAIKKGIDATHADINLASFFEKVIVRETAQVTVWEKCANIKDILLQAEAKFDLHVKSTVGINPQLMMPGNYARQLFDEKNQQHVLHLIPSEDRKVALALVLDKLRVLRRVYRAVQPMREFPEDVANYKKVAVEMGQMLIDNFGYCPWPNYLHKVIEHVQVIIQHEDGPGTVGGLSGEGNEGGKEIFRHFRKNLSRRGDSHGSLRDVLWLHWLYTSPALQRLANVVHTQQRCSVCFQVGHNNRTCKTCT